MKKHHIFLMVMALGMVGLLGCAQNGEEKAVVAKPAGPPIMFLSITSGAIEDTHSVTMALQLAGHALDDERKVVLFFNVRAADIPTKTFPGTIAFKDEPIKALLADLIDRGAEVHVCPHCMQALAVNPDALIKGAQVTDREALFSNLTSNTIVFTY